MTKTLIAFLLALSATAAFAQEHVEKWGKIPDADLKMKVYPEDSSASAVVLQDLASIAVRYDGGGFIVEHTRSRRIKVLDVSAFDQGNLMIPYRSTNSEERLTDLDIQMITPDGEKHKVKSDNVFTEKLTKKWSAKKIFIPDLQKGSIIEYRYRRRSEDLLTLYSWYFQEDIPVRWSEVSMTIPVYFDYVYLMHASRPFDVRESKETSETGNDGTPYMATVTRLAMGNMPALKKEPYITTLDDYLTRIDFQLKSVQFPGQLYRQILTTWEDVAKKMEDDKDFGEQYDKTGNFDDLWKAFNGSLSPGEKPEVIAEKALRFVSSNIKWNGDFRIYPTGTLNDAYEKKVGSSSDLNLAVVALLRKAGVTGTAPMLLSTRSNGQMYPEYPFVTQFNSVVAFMPLGESGLMIDATSPFHTLNEMRREHYNGNGWVIDGKTPLWLDIKAPESSQTWFGDLQLSEEGEMSGVFTLQASGPSATDWRTKLQESSEKEFIKKNFATAYPDLQTDSIVFTDVKNYNNPLKVKFNCRIPGTANVVNDFIYCKPVLDFFIDENPFKTLKRLFPVSFSTPFKAQYVLNLGLPAGYSVEELPEPARINLPDNAGKINFSCSKTTEGHIQLILKMNIAKQEFSPEEYGALRQFFELIHEKTELQLVLKKN